jgi:hypothetical protein
MLTRDLSGTEVLGSSTSEQSTTKCVPVNYDFVDRALHGILYSFPNTSLCFYLGSVANIIHYSYVIEYAALVNSGHINNADNVLSFLKKKLYLILLHLVVFETDLVHEN